LVDADLPADGRRAGAAPGRPVPRAGPLRSCRMFLLPASRLRSPVTTITGTGLLILLGLVPVIAHLLDDAFMLTLFTRIVIMALAAVSLNLILGYGGLISFGHAAYIGIGGYSIGILAHHGITQAWIQWPVA